MVKHKIDAREIRLVRVEGSELLKSFGLTGRIVKAEATNWSDGRTISEGGIIEFHVVSE